MRFSNLLLSFTILLTISSISAQNFLDQTWVNPSVTKSGNGYCCIPTSIDIKSLGNGRYSAYYKYPSMDTQCFRLFMSQSSGLLTLYTRTGSYSDNYYSETTFWGQMTFNFLVSNSNGSPSLNIYTSDSSSYNGCDFIMYTSDSSSSNKTGSLLFFILFLIVITASAAFKNYQKRQSSMIIAQNFAQPQPQTNVTVASYNFNPAPNNIYVAPTVQVHQQFVQQPQVTQVTTTTYTAPGQFIPADAHYSGNGGFNVQGQF